MIGNQWGEPIILVDPVLSVVALWGSRVGRRPRASQRCQLAAFCAGLAPVRALRRALQPAGRRRRGPGRSDRQRQDFYGQARWAFPQPRRRGFASAWRGRSPITAQVAEEMSPSFHRLPEPLPSSPSVHSIRAASEMAFAPRLLRRPLLICGAEEKRRRRATLRPTVFRWPRTRAPRRRRFQALCHFARMPSVQQTWSVAWNWDFAPCHRQRGGHRFPLEVRLFGDMIEPMGSNFTLPTARRMTKSPSGAASVQVRRPVVMVVRKCHRQAEDDQCEVPQRLLCHHA